MTITSEVGRVQTLDGALWSALPEDITLLVLAMLPLRDSARCRAVCKKWQAIWHCPSFLQVRRQLAAERSWFVFKSRVWQAPPSCLCYNPNVNKWMSSMLNNVPATVERVAATAGGLIFCVTKPKVIRRGRAIVSWTWPVMIVCNPLKKNCYTTLPGRQGNWEPDTIGMVEDSRTNSFKIVLARFDRGTEIYDSRRKSWRLLELCRPPRFSSGPEAMSHKGCLYSIGRVSIVKFDVEQEVWGLFDQPHPAGGHARDVRNVQLYDCEGRLLMVGCLKPVDVGQEARLLVWEVVRGISSRSVWRELSSVSIEEVTTAFRPELEMHGGHDDLLFVRGVPRDPISGIMREDFPNVEFQGIRYSYKIIFDAGNAFFYSLSHNAWYVIDESQSCSLQIEYAGVGIRFEPRIETPV